MKVKSEPISALPAPCDHRFRPFCYSGPVRERSLVLVGSAPTDLGYGTLKCQDCGKTEVVPLPDKGGWWKLIAALRPTRDRYTNLPLFRLPWSVVVQKAIGGV